MPNQSNTDVNAAITQGDEQNHKSKKQIVLVAPKGALFQGLIIAMRNHMPALEIVMIEQLPAMDQPSQEVCLVLLYTGTKGVFRDSALACRQNFPQASIGLVIDDTNDGFIEGNLLFDESVQGVLPLSLNLDTWLAALALLSTGGEYYPSFLARRGRDTLSPGHGAMLRDGAEDERLTRRERQVLELLSQGYQNKLIANRMSLSEHTIKLHVHNVITKLRVSNRTQAAATFRARIHAQMQRKSAPGLDFNPEGPPLGPLQ